MNKSGFAFENLVKIEDELWFFDFTNNTICKFSNNKAILDIEYIEREGRHTWGGLPEYGKVYSYENKLILIPWIPADIIVYDTKMRTIKRVSYSFTKYTGMYLCDACIIGHLLYIVPTTYSRIIILDLITDDVKEIDLNEEEGSVLAFGSVALHHDHILFGSLNSDVLFDYNTKKDELRKSHIPELCGGCGGVFNTREHVYYVPKTADVIYEWLGDGISRIVEIPFPTDYNPGEISFHRIVVNEDVFFLPRDANVGVCWRVDAKNMESFSSYRMKAPRYDLNRLMPISYIWKEADEILACLSEQKRIVNLFSGETKSFEVERIKHPSVRGLILEDDNRLTCLEGFVSGLIYGKE